MSRKIVLHSPLAPIALATRLRDVLGDEKAKPKKGVTGHGSEQDMMLFVYRPNVQTNMNVRLTATMQPDGTGTRIEGKIGQASNVTCFMIFWFGFLSIFLVVAGISAINGAPFEFWGPFGGIPLTMMVFGAALVRVGRGPKGKDEKAILEFLARTVQAREA
ncbi:hypothetical protein [Sphingomonas pruni]|jgi:hypothetical protein|uniref:hypothetical protein n=1 Tax=Sphingomonas pruni TaxID=40683 RepID=UPI00083788FB|nr:hypothetical protein [Sphingomonas pruni]